MAIDMNSPQYDHIPINSCKLGDILLAENSGRLDYVKITNISTAKPGKHGSAKFLIKGTNVLSKKTYEVSYTSGTKVIAVKLKRAEYLVADIFGEEIHTMSASADAVGDTPVLLKSDFSPEEISLLERAYNERGDDDITVMLVTAPSLLFIEDIRKGGKLLDK